jgi:hypothetical protein
MASLAGRETIGYAGVAKAGDEDGMGSFVMFAVLNRGAGALGVWTGSLSSIVQLHDGIYLLSKIESQKRNDRMSNDI